LEDVRAHRDDVLAALGDPSVRLVDVRSPAEYAGEMPAPAHLPHEHARVAGRIPGAVNVPWGRATGPDGAFLPDEQLAAIYAGAGVADAPEVITYCRVGERSSHTWFVLHELLGLPRVRNYDGSWTEWGSLVGVPVERGA
jgi:thiosulfate/3-mercaptopyruvate sulfurtransferase